MDYKNKVGETDKNIIIYGHNRKNDSMFGTLKNVLTKEWQENEDNILTLLTCETTNNSRVVLHAKKIK